MSAVVTSISGLQNLVNLQQFRGDFNAFTEIDFSGLTNLTYVDVSDCNIPGTSTNSLVSINLSGCTALEELRLDDSNFLAGVSSLAGLTNLNYLDLDQCNITGSINLSGLTNLRGFDLSGNTGLTEVILTGLNNLEWIQLDECSIAGSINLSALPSLRGFNLSDNVGLTEVIISSSQPLGNGEPIYIYDCALTETAVDNILVALSTNGITGGYLDMSGVTNAIPSSTGLAAKSVLEGNGWNVYVSQP